MKPVTAKYREEIQLYNLEDDYPVSCLLLDICTDLDISPAQVEFTTLRGEPLPEEGVLSDIRDFESSKLLYVLVADTPGVDDYHDNDIEMVERDAMVSISLPSHDETKMKLDGRDTMGSLVGQLILKDLIDLDVDLFIQKRDTTKKNREFIRQSSPPEGMKCKHAASVQDVNLAEGDCLCIVDRAASKQNDELFQPDVVLDLQNFGILRKYCLNSSDSISQTLGSLLSSGRLGTKFFLNFDGNGDTDEEDDFMSCKDKTPIGFNSSSEKKMPFIKKFALQDGDKLLLTSQRLRAAPVQDEEFLADDFVCVKCCGYVGDGWVTWDLTISRENTVSELIKHLIEDRKCKDIEFLYVDRHPIADSQTFFSDSRSLIDDCGVRRNSVIVAKGSSSALVDVKVIHQNCFSNQDEVKTLQFQVDVTGSTIKTQILQLFELSRLSQNVYFLLYQLGRRELHESSTDIQVWAADDTTQWVNLETESVASADLAPRETEKLMRVIGDDDMLLFAGGHTPVLYFVNDAKYYQCLKRYQPGEFESIRSPLNPWTDVKYLMYLGGIQIRDITNSSITRYLMGSGDSFADAKSGRRYTRDQISKSNELVIPVENREIKFFYLFIEQNTHLHALNLPPHKVRIWTRNGMSLGYENSRIFCRGRVCEDFFQWCRQFSGSSEVERAIYHDSYLHI